MVENTETRRGARIAARFWIGVEGDDSEPSLRRGNLSASGLYFETKKARCPAGSVQFLHIESEDHLVVVQVLARVIRATEIDDISSGQTFGLAMEFMPSSAKGRRNLERLVRHIVELGLRADESVHHQYEVVVTGHDGADRSTLQHLSVEKLTLETDWAAEVGDTMQVQIAIPGQNHSLPMEGQVVSVEAGDSSYSIAVRIVGISPTEEHGQSPPDALAALIAETSEDFALPARDHLSGHLNRISLTSLLALMEMERMSGHLDLQRAVSPKLDGNAAAPSLPAALDSLAQCTLMVKEGRVLDVIPSTSNPEFSLLLGEAPREILRRAISWPEGEFQFEMREVKCPDKLQCSTTGLLLNLAKEADENDAVSQESFFAEGDEF